MEERLKRLRYDLGLEWGELADKLEISRAMLNFVRKGNRKPSAALLLRITELERAVATSAEMATKAQPGVDWRARALDAEAQPRRYKAAFAKIVKSNKLIAEVLDDLQEGGE